MAFMSMLDFNRSKHCLSDASFPKRVSDSPPLMCRPPKGSSGSLSIGPLCDLSRNMTRAHGSLSYCLGIENLTRKCHTFLQELNLVAVSYFSYYDSKKRDTVSLQNNLTGGALECYFNKVLLCFTIMSLKM